MDWTVQALNTGGEQDLPHPSIPAPKPTQPPVQQVIGFFPMGEVARAQWQLSTPFQHQGYVWGNVIVSPLPLYANGIVSLLLLDVLEYHYHTQYNDNTNIQSTDVLWLAEMAHFYET